MTQPLQYIIVEGRRPQNGSAPMRATIIFDARLSPVGMTAGAARAHTGLSDCGMIETGPYPLAVKEGYSKAELSSTIRAAEQAVRYAEQLEKRLTALAAALGCRADEEVMLARAAVLVESESTLAALDDAMRAKEKALEHHDIVVSETFAPLGEVCQCAACKAR